VGDLLTVSQVRQGRGGRAWWVGGWVGVMMVWVMGGRCMGEWGVAVFFRINDPSLVYHLLFAVQPTCM